MEDGLRYRCSFSAVLTCWPSPRSHTAGFQKIMMMQSVDLKAIIPKLMLLVSWIQKPLTCQALRFFFYKLAE